MKLGFFTMPIHPLGRDWRETLREDQEALLLADELGYSEAYVGEHVTDLAENITSCIVFLASLAGRVKQMRLGTGTVNMPNVHPATVAAQIAMLDHLLEGRFNFGISPGGLLSDAEAFGNLDADRGAMFLTGHSMGSGGTWYLGATYAQYWKAMAPMSGPFVEQATYPWDRIRKMPVFMTEGTGATPSLAGSRVMQEWMKSQGFPLEYIEVDADHGRMVALVLPAVFDFFDRQRKK